MMHKYAVEAVDHMLQDLMDNALPFGGKVVIFSGDFKQMLPVILKGTPGLILEACLKNSYLWSNVAKFHLTVNMRLTNNNSESVREFAGLLKSIGHGTYPHVPNSVPITFDYLMIWRFHTIRLMIWGHFYTASIKT
ncbi:hypothetical protein Ae201684P_003510 [Aphanomyces euteiches]|nr:hypothetical protein Ae201684P_003510 [Aphanomyces euteiches]